MTFFYQINNNDHYNRIYQSGIIPSGQGLAPLPYSFGQRNKYSPKPFGLPIAAIAYSKYVDAGFRQYKNINVGSAQYTHAVYGPVNYIYEVDVSGIENVSQSGIELKCRKCDRLNGRYYLYMLDDGSIGDLIPGDIGSTIQFVGDLCGNHKRFELCRYTNPLLEFKGIGTSGTRIDFSLTQSTAGFGNGSKTHIFRKDFPVFNANLDDDVNFGANKIMALDNEYNLLYVPESSVAVYTDSPDISSGDFDCKFLNAIVAVRPFKSSFYDVRNINKYFRTQSSGYPVDTLGNNGVSDGLVTFPTFNPCAPQHIEDSGWFKLTPGTAFSSIGEVEPVGDNGRFPPSLQIWLSGVINTDNKPNCISCTDYFKFPFILDYAEDLIIAPPSGYIPGAVTGGYGYKWVGYSNRWFTTDIDYNYFNICDLGCSTADYTHNSGVNGPCSNRIELGIFYHASGSYSKWIASLGFFGRDTHFNRRSGLQFTKTLCEGTFGTGIPHGCFQSINGTTFGGINCFHHDIWNSGWSLYDGEIYGEPSKLPPNLDISGYCNFSGAIPVITPVTNFNFPCERPKCAPCWPNQVPQSANLDLEIWQTDISGNNATKIYDNVLILSIDKFPVSSPGSCNVWGLSSSGLEAEIAGFTLFSGVLSGGGTVDFTPPDLGSSGGAEFGVTFSGPNVGVGVANWGLDCSVPLTGILGLNPSGIASTYTIASVTFTDTYSILDYL